MGFLDNSTNNIIVDAVLTDLGREMLAKQTFDIAKFAFGDDEVDYSMIKKFGRTVGKQKIELNTPVFEAQTNQNLALKYRLLTYNEPTLFRLPQLSLVGVPSGIISLNTTSQQSQTLIYEQTLVGENELDVDTIDANFLVTINSRFLKLLPESTWTGAETHVDADGIAQYLVGQTSSTSQGGGKCQVEIATRTLSQNIFTFYGDSGTTNQITTQVSVQGLQSGARVDTTVVITQG